MSRCAVLGAGASAGVLRKNLMICEVVADTPIVRPGVEALQVRKLSDAQYTRIERQRPDHFLSSEDGCDGVLAAAAAAIAGVPALGSPRISNLPLKYAPSSMAILRV